MAEGGAGEQRPECGGPGGVMAGSFGDADSVRRLGQALLAAGRGAASVTSDLSRQVGSVVPSGWSGEAAEAFRADWHRKAGRAGQLAAVCMHVGQVLTELAAELDAAGQQGARAQQAAGGPAASRFGDPVSEQRAEQMLSRAAGAAEQARAAARSKLAGLQVPQIGPPLTASQVQGWASGLAPGRVPVFNRLFGTLLGDVSSVAQRTGLAAAWGEAEKKRAGGLPTIGQEAHFAEGIADGLTGMVRGVADLLPGPDGGLGRWLWGDPSESQSLQGLAHLTAPFLGVYDPASPAALENFGKSFVAWDEWHTDPARAAGTVTFNLVSLFAGTKLLRPWARASTKTPKALDGADQADSGETTEKPGQPPGPAPAAFGRSVVDGSTDHPELPASAGQQVEYRVLRTPTGEPVPLFDGPPTVEQAIQRNADDCGLVATLRALARHRPETLQKVMQGTPDGGVIVRLNEVTLSETEAVATGRTIELRMSRELPTWKDSGTAWSIPVSNSSWAALAEKALAAIDQTWTDERMTFNNDLWRAFAEHSGLDEGHVRTFADARGYARLNRGFFPHETAEVMAQLTGERAGIVGLGSAEDAESTLTRLLNERKPVMAISRADEEIDPEAHGVIGSHWYEITGIEGGKVILKNPWGRADPVPVPAEEFLKEFYALVVTVG